MRPGTDNQDRTAGKEKKRKEHDDPTNQPASQPTHAYTYTHTETRREETTTCVTGVPHKPNPQPATSYNLTSFSDRRLLKYAFLALAIFERPVLLLLRPVLSRCEESQGPECRCGALCLQYSHIRLNFKFLQPWTQYFVNLVVSGSQMVDGGGFLNICCSSLLCLRLFGLKS